ncbi:hypothetical protein ACGF0J_19245 [Nonomuraea sp. NPDC047897]|uniref:hypothetical protein n=1 Tax=Nonomuraea sp. NPDC047897 TaxID=3364346 RepID=UPI003717CFC5
MADERKVPSQQRAEGGPGDDDLRVVVAKDDTLVHGSDRAGERDEARAGERDEVRAGGRDEVRAGDGRDRPAVDVTDDVRDPHAKDYKDPYTAPPEDVPVAGGPGPMVRGQETGAAGGMPSHAAPQETALFDRDPADVQARWRDLQAGFVDDPGDAVKRADGLVGEVVESLTSALTQRTSELRGRWQGSGEHDTEQLRQALREYRGVLERLLAVSGGGTDAGAAATAGSGTGAGMDTGPHAARDMTRTGSPMSPGMR